MKSALGSFSLYWPMRVLALLGLLLLCACSSDSASEPGSKSPRPEAMPQLPPLSDLPRGISALSPLTCAAQEYETGLPSAGVTAVSGGLRFNSSSGGQGLSGLAYAVYGFNLGTLSGSQSLYLLQHDSAFVAAGGMQDLYVGLANFDTGRWVWRRASAEVVDGVFPISTIEHYAADDGSAFVAVMLGGARTFQLDALSFLRYDEVEPNDSAADGINQTPPGDYAGLRGSLGTATGYPGYDGDNVDYWQIELDNEIAIGADVYYDNDAASFELAIVDSAGYVKAGTPDGDGRIHVQDELFNAVHLGLIEPIYLRITALSGGADYTLVGRQGTLPEAQFSQDAVCGDAPLTVTFDSALSSDPDGSIVGWFWDMDDPAQTVALDEAVAMWTFSTAEQDYRVTLTVVDNEGFTASRSRLIRTEPAPFNEWEDNDSSIQTQPYLGAFIFGDVGGAANGFDGDNEDYFSFALPAGQTLVVKLSAFEGNAPSGAIAGDLSGGNINKALNHLGEGSGPDVPNAEDVIVRLSVNTADSFPHRYRLNARMGVAPVASLAASPPTGPAPYVVNFIATASDEADDELNYKWDTDLSGSFETDSGTVSVLTMNVAAPGALTVAVRITNDLGIYVERRATAVGF